MFLTGFSSPFISIFLALVLPWLVVVLGKSTGQKIIAESKVIFHIEENKEKPIDLQENFYFFSIEKTKGEKQSSIFCKSDLSYIYFRVKTPDYLYPANSSEYTSLLQKSSGNRAPPAMFTIIKKPITLFTIGIF